MRRWVALAVGLLLCQIALSQDRYVYSGGSKLTYVISDTLKSEYLKSDYFSETTTVRVGSYVQYTTTRAYINTGDEWKQVSTTYKPRVFGFDISEQSLHSLKTWLCYVKEKYPEGDPSTKYCFADETRELLVYIVKPSGYNVWMLSVGDREMKADIVDRLIATLEELETILEGKQTEYYL